MVYLFPLNAKINALFVINYVKIKILPNFESK
jgi:hypothetical protein